MVLTMTVVMFNTVMMIGAAVSRVSTDDTPESDKPAARVIKPPQRVPLIRFTFSSVFIFCRTSPQISDLQLVTATFVSHMNSVKSVHYDSSH